MIRYARPVDDAHAISAVVSDAFGRPDEARLVERLRAAADAMFELVAEVDGRIVGHVLFSRLWADSERLYSALAPLAVSPAYQGQGLGSALVRAGLESAPEFGASGVLVLGDPAYYGRFGFSARTAAHVKSPWRDKPEFMALGLDPGAFAAPLTVAYPNAFSEV